MLNDVQLYNLLLITELDEMCRRHDVQYYLAGGSVIGVLRHKGFIPWDDDLDIYMTRDNWEKFKAAFDEEAPAHRELQCSDIDPNYPNVTAKYVSTDTTAVYRNLLTGEFNSGVIIDILILDPVPDNEKDQADYLKSLLAYNEFVNPYYVFAARFEMDNPYEPLREREREIGHEQLVRELEAEVTKYPETDTCCYALRWGGVPHVFDKSLFGTPKYVPFEGIYLPVPERAYLYLSQLYGEDWIQIPPHSEEIVHDAVFSIHQSSDVFYREYERFIDAESYVETVTNRKRNRLNAAPHTRLVQNRNQNLEALRLAMHLKRDDERLGLRKLYDEGRFEELAEIFEELFSVQCSSRFLGNKFHAGFYRYFHPIYSDIGDDLLWLAVELLCRRGAVHHPKRMIEARQFNDASPLTDEVKVQWRNLERIIDAVDSYERGDIARSVRLVEEGLAEKPDWIGFIKFKIYLILKGEIDGDVESLIEAGMAVAPEDGEWLKFKGDLVRDSDSDEAMRLYNQAREATDNGFALLAIDEFVEEQKARKLDKVSDLVAAGSLADARQIIESNEEDFEFRLLSCDDIMKAADGDAVFAQRIVGRKRAQLLEGRTIESDTSMEAYWRAMGAGDEDLDVLNELWSKQLRSKYFDASVEDEQEISSPVVMKERGDWALVSGAYDVAYECYYAALAAMDENELLLVALREAFHDDLVYFYEKFTEDGEYLNSHGRLYRAWLLRHGSTENWIEAVSQLGMFGQTVGENAQGEAIDVALKRVSADDDFIMFCTVLGALKSAEKALEDEVLQDGELEDGALEDGAYEDGELEDGGPEDE